MERPGVNNDAAANSRLPLIIVGGGGHAKVLVDTLRVEKRRILGFVDPRPSLPPLLDVARLGDDSIINASAPSEIRLVNGVGSIGCTSRRREIHENFCAKHYHFETVIHPSAIVASDVLVEEGAQIMAGAVVQPGSQLGANAIINTGALVDHDCTIGSHAHIGPGVTLSGGVIIGQGAHVGTGAAVIQGIKVGAGSIVGAGAVVIRDVPPGVTVVGVPGRVIVKVGGLKNKFRV